MELLLLCMDLQDAYGPGKLFAASHRHKNTRMNYAVYQTPLQQNRRVGFLIIELTQVRPFSVQKAQREVTAIVKQRFCSEGKSQQLCFKLFSCWE